MLSTIQLNSGAARSHKVCVWCKEHCTPRTQTLTWKRSTDIEQDYLRSHKSPVTQKSVKIISKSCKTVDFLEIIRQPAFILKKCFGNYIPRPTSGKRPTTQLGAIDRASSQFRMASVCHGGQHRCESPRNVSAILRGPSDFIFNVRIKIFISATQESTNTKTFK
jgi:hypothetical protein